MTELIFAVESWAQYWPEAKPLVELHWQEIALDQEHVPLAVDEAGYVALDGAGILHIVTARDEGRLVGYWLGMVKGHLHYRTTLHAVMDVVWLHPAYRRGVNGYQLFHAVERTLRQRGVVKVIMGCKLHLDFSRLYARLGYHEIERTWSKLLREES